MMIYLCVYVCSHVCMFTHACMKDRRQHKEPVLSFYHVGHENRSQVARLDLLTMSSHVFCPNLYKLLLIENAIIYKPKIFDVLKQVLLFLF